MVVGREGVIKRLSVILSTACFLDFPIIIPFLADKDFFFKKLLCIRRGMALKYMHLLKIYIFLIQLVSHMQDTFFQYSLHICFEITCSLASYCYTAPVNTTHN